MKKIAFILVAFVSVACNGFIDEQPIYRIEPRTQQYVDKFFQEAESRGVKLKKENLIVVVTDSNPTMLGNAAGMTTFIAGQRYIYLWTGAFDYFVEHGKFAEAERLVFHELGHAFRRHHVDYKSIMNPNCPSEVYAGNDSIRTAMVSELISKIQKD